MKCCNLRLLLACLVFPFLIRGTVDPTQLVFKECMGDARLRHYEVVTSIVYNQDGSQLLTASRDGTIRIWDRDSRKELSRLVAAERADIWDARFLPGEKSVLFTTAGDSVAEWIPGAKAPAHARQFKEKLLRLSISPDASRVAVTDYEDAAMVLSIVDFEDALPALKHDRAVYCVRWSPDGKFLATCSSDHSLRIWGSDSGEEIHKCLPDAGDLYTVEFSPDGMLLAVCTEKKGLELYEFPSLEKKWTSEVTGPVRNVQWMPDGQGLVCATDQAELVYVSVAGGTIDRKSKLPAGTSYAIAVSREGSEIAVSCGSRICLYEAKPFRRIFPETDASPLAAGDSRVLRGGTDRQYWIHPEGGVGTLRGGDGAHPKILLPDQKISTLSLTPGSGLPVAGDETGQIWVMDDQDEVRFAFTAGERIRKLVVTADGRTLACWSGTRNVQIWDLSNGELFLSLPVSGGSLRDIIFSPGGAFLCTIGYNTVETWSPETGQSLQQIKISGGSLTAGLLHPSREGELLAHSKDTLFYWPSENTGGLPLTRAQVQEAIQQLGAPHFRERRQATRTLGQASSAILPWLREVESDDPEVQARLEEITQELIGRLTLRDGDRSMTHLPFSIASVVWHPEGEFIACASQETEPRLLLMKFDGTEFQSVKELPLMAPCSRLSFPESAILHVDHADGTVSVFAFE